MYTFLGAISNTMLYNALNFPAGVVPVTTVTEADEKEMAQHKGIYGDSWDRTLKKVCMNSGEILRNVCGSIIFEIMKTFDFTKELILVFENNLLRLDR